MPSTWLESPASRLAYRSPCSHVAVRKCASTKGGIDRCIPTTAALAAAGRAPSSLDRLLRPDAPERGPRQPALDAAGVDLAPGARAGLEPATTPGSAIARTAAPSAGRPGAAPAPRRAPAPCARPRAACGAPSRRSRRRRAPAATGRIRRRTSSGRPRRTNAQSTRWSSDGPRRALAVSARIETKRGSGRLVTGPRPRLGAAACARPGRAAASASAPARAIPNPSLMPDLPVASAGKCRDCPDLPVPLSCRR